MHPQQLVDNDASMDNADLLRMMAEVSFINGEVG